MAQATYNSAGPRYDGGISVASVDFAWKGIGTSGVQVTAAGSMEKEPADRFHRDREIGAIGDRSEQCVW